MVAAAVVGISLLPTPIHQTQAQVLSPSHISGVTLYAAEASDFNLSSDIEAISVDFHVFDTSPILALSLAYDVLSFWTNDEPGLAIHFIPDFGSSAYRTASWEYSRPLL